MTFQVEVKFFYLKLFDLATLKGVAFKVLVCPFCLFPLSFLNLQRRPYSKTLSASDELKYFQEAQERVKVLHEKRQEASNKLATTLINLKRKFSSRTGKDRQSRRKKESKRKVGKLKEKRLQQRAYLLLEKLTSREEAGEVFDAIKTNNSFTSIATIDAELTGKQVTRLHLDPLLWLLEKAVFNKNITRTLQVVEASLSEKSTEGSSSNEHSADKSDEEDIQELAEEEELTAAWLAQLGERRSAEREVAGSNPGWTNTQGL